MKKKSTKTVKKTAKKTTKPAVKKAAAKKPAKKAAAKKVAKKGPVAVKPTNAAPTVTDQGVVVVNSTED